MAHRGISKLVSGLWRFSPTGISMQVEFSAVSIKCQRITLYLSIKKFNVISMGIRFISKDSYNFSA